jgi:hypothetical protein
MNLYELFLKAIKEKWIIMVKIDSSEKGLIHRKCIPYDFGPSNRYKDGQNRYHFYDLDSPDGAHNLSILPHQLIELQILDEKFDPKNFVTWKQPKWYVQRDWGEYS